MVLNPFALTSFFSAAVSLLLMAGAALTAIISYRRIEECEGPDERAQAESRLHLAFLLLVTAFLLRLAAWPLFYILLQSFIPLVPGAMCIFGTTRVMPGFVAFIQTLKPAAFFLIGGWLIAHSIGLSLKTHSVAQANSRLLIWASAIAAADALAEIAFVLNFAPPGVAVSCCTAVGDIVVPSAPLLPLPLFEDRYARLIAVGYHASSLSLAGLLVLLLWGTRKNAGQIARRGRMALTALMAALTGVIAYAAFGEYLGPRLMGLPDHHCLYCLLQYRPISILILGLLVFGLFSALWPFFLRFAVPSEEGQKRIPGITRKLFQSSLFCLLTSWLLTTLLAWNPG